MDPARIAALLAPFLGPVEDDGADLQKLFRDISTYIDILLRWNARLNLTAIRDPDQIVTRHFGESLFAARHLFPRERAAPDASGRAALQGRVVRPNERGALARDADEESPPPNPETITNDVSLADVGSGAGFPGIPIKLWAPQITLTLIESSHKKSTFLREITRALTLTDINILTARAETIRQDFDVVTLRAVERFADVLPAAARLVALGGRLALLIGATQLDQARTLLPDFFWEAPIPIPASHSRALVVGKCATHPRAERNQSC